jgi:TonB family protein
MHWTEEKEPDGLMRRMVVMSLIAHVLFLSLLLGVMFMQKRPKIIPLRLMRIESAPPKIETLATKPQPPREPPKREEPIKTIEPKTRKIVQKQVEKKEEKPKPVPTPKATPKPKATPAEAKKTPAPVQTPSPRPTVASTPRPPAPAAPRVTPPLPAPPAPPVAGPLTMQSLDLPDYYMLNARQKIESYFSVPANAKNRQLVSKAAFTIMKDGTITNIRIVQSTGDPLLDQAGVRALTLTKELGPLPDSVSKNSIDAIVTFDYSADW